MNIGDKITTLRKQKDMSQTDLGKAVGVSREIIGRYERNEVLPSIEVAAKIANALEVSLDFLAGNTDQLLEKNIIQRISDIQKLPQDDKAHLFALMDAFLRDHKTKKVYAS
jgi:transcriptional regulator with XRE-family HTH domain